MGLATGRTGPDEWAGTASWSWGEEGKSVWVSTPKLSPPRPACPAMETGAVTCGCGASTRSRRKAWVGGTGLASRPIAATVTVTTESRAADSGTSSHRRPQADSLCSSRTLRGG